MADSIFTKDRLLPIFLNGVAVLAFGAALTGWLNPKLGILIMAVVPLYWLWEILTAKAVSEKISGKYRLLIGVVVISFLAIVFGPPACKKLTAEEPKPLTATEIADAVSKKRTEEMRSHLIITGYQFPKVLSSGKVMYANYIYKNMGELDAQSQFPWRVAVDEVFLNEPEKQRAIEDRLFEAMLAAPRNCPTLDVPVQGQQYQSVPLPLRKPQIDAINSGEGAIYVMGRLKYWDKNGEHHTDFCSFLAKGSIIGDCKGHNQAP